MAFCRFTHFMRRGSPTIAPSMRQWFCRDDASVTSRLYFERLNSNCAGRAPEGKGSQSPTHAPRWRSTRQSDAMNQRFSFTSNCPRCQRDRVIETYTRGALLRLLDLGSPIEASCAECAAHWTVGAEARVQIARAVAASVARSLR